MQDNKEVYTQYLRASNVDGSGKASSYVRSLDLLSQMLGVKSFGFDDCENVWAVSSRATVRKRISLKKKELKLHCHHRIIRIRVI